MTNIARIFVHSLGNGISNLNREVNKGQKIVNKAQLNRKLKAPKNTQLNDKETAILIEDWETQFTANDRAAEEMTSVSNNIEHQLSRLGSRIVDVSNDLVAQQEEYCRTRSKETRSIIARRIVITGQTFDQLKVSKKQLKEAVKKVKEVYKDAQMAKLVLDTRIQEAKIYRALNGGLKLIGMSLSEARKEHVVAKIEYDNFIVNIDNLDKSISNISPEEVEKKAKKYLKKLNTKGS